MKNRQVLSAYKSLWSNMNKKEKLGLCSLIFLVIFRCFSVVAITQVLTCLVDKILGFKACLFGNYLPESWNIIQVVIFTHILLILIWCTTALIGHLIVIFATHMSCKVNKIILKTLIQPRKNLDYKMTNGEAVFIANMASESVVYLIKDLLLKVFIPIGACIIALVYIAQINLISFVIFFLCFIFILISSFIRLIFQSRYQKRIEESKSKINNVYLNNIENISLITLLDSKVAEEKNLNIHNQDYKVNSIKDSSMRMKYWFFAYLLQYVLVGLGIIACIIDQGVEFVNLASVVALVSYSQQLCSPLENVGVELGALQVRAIQYNRLNLLKLNNQNCLIKKSNSNYCLPKNKKINKISLIDVKIEIGSFSKKYQNINFVTNKINVIKGDSGCGKSVLIGSLLGLKEYKKGKIIINDKYTINSLLDYKNKVSLVSQNEMMFDRPIIENIAYPNYTLTKKMKEYISIFNLEYLLNRSYNDINVLKSLSGGEQKRISIIRGMSKVSEVYIFDEPTNDLDLKNVKIFINQIKKIKRNAMVIIISHDERIINIADSIVDIN